MDVAANLTSVINNAELVLRELERNGHGESAGELRGLISGLGEARTREESLVGIEGMCHIKWLGELNIPNMSVKKWWGLLENLRATATAKLNEIRK